MRAVVVQFPGSNADFDAVHTLSRVVGVRTDLVFHKSKNFSEETRLVVLPGGFSYGDHLRAGAIAKLSPVMTAVRDFIDRGGFVLGICNGFQILTEAAILPGALTRNGHLRFECRDVTVRVDAEGPFTQGLRGRTLRLPIAHAEGRYYADETTLTALETDGRIALRYVPDETVSPSRLSANPNGSAHDIAGLYGGPRRNVLGLMPHPERSAEALLGSDDGRLLFDAVVRTALSR